MRLYIGLMELRVLQEREEILMNSCELSTLDSFVLNKLDISVFSEERNYWLLRTQGGTYFDEFYFNNYIGIEWDDIVDNTIKSMETMAQIVSKKYPEEKRATYVAGQIWKFIHDFKKGDIVLIPNKDSKIIAFGEILEDDIYVSDDGISDPFAQLSIPDDEDSNSIPVLRKRRRVKWIKTIKRELLDPHLQTFIYAHNTIVDLNPYAIFIDRTLSNFYIKGDSGYFTLRVNKPENIPLDDLTDLFIFNRSLQDFINKHFPDYLINRGEIICKIDVQSKGPIQFTGPIKKITLIGLVLMFLCGGSIKFTKSDGLEISSEGITAIIDSAANVYDIVKTHQEKEEYSDLKEDYNKLYDEYSQCQKQLELSAPQSNTTINLSDAGASSK